MVLAWCSDTAPVDKRVESAIAAFEAAYRERDFSRVRPVVSTDVIVDWSNSIGPYRGTYHGVEEAERFFSQFAEAFAELEWRASDTVLVASRLAMQGNVVARGAGSGVEGTGRGGQAWTLDADGRVKEVRLFQSRDEALRWIRAERLRDARLYFVCDARPKGRDPRPLLEAALRGGADILQLRDKELDDEALVAAAAPFREAARAHAALFILNDRPDLVDACGADGVHVGQEDMPVTDARLVAGQGALVGRSTHTPEQVDEALDAEGDARPDQISVGPVWGTPTKPGREAAGLELVRHAAKRGGEAAWFAIGGIDRSNVGEVAAAGAERVVVVRAIRDAPDPERAARALRAALERTAPPGDGRTRLGKLASAGYEAINRRDLDAFLALLDPEVEFVSLIAEVEGPHVYRGHAGVREWWDRLSGALREVRYDPEKIHDFGDRGYVAVLITTAVAGGEVPQRRWVAGRTDDGLFTWLRVFRSEAEAREAIELPATDA